MDTPNLPHPKRWAILPVLCLSLFLVVVDNTIVNVALPTISRTLGATTTQLQWIVDAYSLVFAGLLLAFGSLGDRFGRKGALQLGLVLFALCSTVAAFVGSADALIAARATMGIGAALVFPATLAILTNVFTEPVERAKAIGIWSAVSGLAVALGPLTGGFLLEHFWWGSIFLVNLPVVAIALFFGQRLLPTMKDPDAGRLDPVGVVLSSAAVVLLVYTIIEAPKHGWTELWTIRGFAAALVLFAAFVTWELRSTHPMLDVRVFRNPRFSAASLSVSIAFFSLFGFIFLITQYFQFVLGYSTLSAGLHTLPFAFAAAIGAPLAAKLSVSIGTKRMVAAGLGSMAIGFVWASTLDVSSSYWGSIVFSMMFIGAGLTMTTAPSTAAILGSLPPAKAGVGSAMNDTTRELGGTLGVAVVGSVFSSLYGPKLVDGLRGLPVPAEALEAAKSSVQAAAAVAERAPTPQAGQVVLDAARQAFVDGMHGGARVCAVASLVGVAVALAFLPAQAPETRVDLAPDASDPVEPATVD
ncbi:MFS transporter [soil metagenome]